MTRFTPTFKAKPAQIHGHGRLIEKTAFQLFFDSRGLIPMEQLHCYPQLFSDGHIEIHGHLGMNNDRALIVDDASENAKHLIGRIEAREATLENMRLEGAGWISGVAVRDLS